MSKDKKLLTSQAVGEHKKAGKVRNDKLEALRQEREIFASKIVRICKDAKL